MTTDVRVHFPEEQSPQNEIGLLYDDSNHIINVYVGFLQIHHQYHIEFDIKDNFHEDLTSDPLHNLHCKIIDVRPTEDGEGHAVTVDFCAYKEKILKEELKLVEPQNDGRILTLIIHARVLGKGKGTPSLKNGVKLVGVNVDEDSEQSDWQGFD